jgi:hypothetical protein
MRAVNYITLFVSLLVFSAKANTPEDGFCAIRNTTTQNGEEISYTVYYSVAGVYVDAGSATFTNKVEKLNGKTVYHVTGIGSSNKAYDWIYKVRDKYESYIDTATMLPVKFSRDVQEGKTKKKETISFNHSAGTVTSDSGTVKAPACLQDVMSTIYYSRNIDFTKYKSGDKIPFKMFLENEVHQLYIRYLGKESVTTKFGKFNAIKFKPLLVEGTIFSGGEKMVVWVSDDANRIPVRIQSPILIGSIKVDMTGYKNLRHALSSLKKEK